MKHLNVINDEKKAEWVDIVLFLSKIDHLDINRVLSWSHQFANITILSSDMISNYALPKEIRIVCYDSAKGRSEIWNDIVSESNSKWVLFLEDDEEFDADELKKINNPEPDKWIPARVIQFGKNEKRRQFFQMRLVPGLGKDIYDGVDLPDATRFITENGIQLSGKTLEICRVSDPVIHVNTDDEMALSNFSPQLYLVAGYRLLEEKKFAYAAGLFRTLLKKEKLLPFDRLAAVNGLASCYTEQYKWKKALALANESIEAEPQQFLPYLIKFKIFQLNKQWNESLDVLTLYHEILSESGYSRSNYEKFISLEETVTQLANLAIKTGLRKAALNFYEELFSLKKGNVDHTLLNILLVLSIELIEYEKSVFYFKKIFEEYLPDRLSEEKNQQLNDFLSMFMVNGWYDYPSEVYDMLYEQESENGEYRRRLIVTLSKTNRLDRARKIIVQNM